LVVATALSTIRHDLGASLEALQWTMNAYNLSFAVLLLTGAALGDRFGRRRIFIAGLGLFVAASAACALAGSAAWLIAARTVQGAGAALVMPLAMALLSAAFPRDERGKALGLFSGVTGLALIAGPVVGGAVAEGLAWPWIFWLNIPIGLIAMPLAHRRIPESVGPGTAIDSFGVVLVTGAALGVVWGLPIRSRGRGDAMVDHRHRPRRRADRGQRRPVPGIQRQLPGVLQQAKPRSRAAGRGPEHVCQGRQSPFRLGSQRWPGLHPEDPGGRRMADPGSFEHTVVGVLDTGADLGLLAEYLYDGRGAGAPPTPFDHDVFLGARLVLNDAQDTNVLAGVVVDLERGSTALSLEASRRIGARWRLEVETRAFANISRADVLFGVRRDSFLQVRLAWFF
jgi:hypothetical protein